MSQRIIFFTVFLVISVLFVGVKGGGNNFNQQLQQKSQIIAYECGLLRDITKETIRYMNIISHYFLLIPITDRNEFMQHHRQFSDMYDRLVPQGGILSVNQYVENRNDFVLAIQRLYITSYGILKYLLTLLQQPQAHQVQTQAQQVQHALAQNQQVQHALAQNQQVQHALVQNQQVQHALAQNQQVQHALVQNQQVQHAIAQNQQVQHALAQNQQAQHALAQNPQAQHTLAQNQQVQHVLAQNQQVQHALAQNQQAQIEQVQNGQAQPGQYALVQNQQIQNSQVNQSMKRRLDSQGGRPRGQRGQ